MDTRPAIAARHTFTLFAAFALSLMSACGDDSHRGGAATPSSTPAHSATATRATTGTASPASSNTPAPTATATAPAAATPTGTATAPAATPTSTATPPAAATPTGTSAPSATATQSATPTATSIVADARIEGPVTGGNGTPWVQSTRFTLADLGYAQAEYFMAGTAQAYTNVSPLGEDGHWQAALSGVSAAYKTRLLVYRPIDAQRFNGTVVVEWFNVSGGLDAAPDWTSTHTELIRQGYAWVGVSAQRLGVEGGGGPFNLSLKAVDSARYGSLSHPGDSFSYDIFSQAARALIAPTGIDLLGGLQPARLIGAGESQSAFRLVTYVNAVHPLARLFDGFLIHSRSGGGAALAQAPQDPVDTPGVVRIRTDLEEPVLTFQTETDLLSLNYLPARQEDSDMFRLWEVAGTAHADSYTLLVGFDDKGDTPAGAECLVVSAPIPGFIMCDRSINSGPQHWVLKAAIAALDRWVRGEGAPPMAPRLELSGSPPEFVLDELGNVRGGIRTASVDAPLATLSGLGQTGGTFCGIFGTTVPLSAETLAGLYESEAAYVAAVNEATDAAVQAGFLLPADALLIKEGAETYGMQCREV